MPQSVINDIKTDDKVSMKKVKDGYLFTSKVNYKNNSSLLSQEVLIDNNYNIKKVTVFDANNAAQITVNYNLVDMKAKFNNNYFVLEKNMENDLKDEQTAALDDAIYPMYLPKGTYLDKEKEVELDKGSRIILTFAGEKPFMLVEETATKESEATIVPTSGDIDILGDGVASVSTSSVSWISSGVSYYLVSDSLSKADLLSVAKSVTTVPVSK